MRDTLEFLKAALRRPMEVSTVFPTSKYLAEALLSYADLASARSVAELGPGTGAITRYLQPKLIDGASYIGIEIDKPMVDYLKLQYPKMRFEVGLAETLSTLVPPGSVDAVVSSLPWTIFPSEMQERTVKAIVKALKPGGVFVTYVCVNALVYPQAKSFINRLSENFREVHRGDLEWRNIPPAFVYRSVK
jgi:phosphatidylethanolamine/phosphatidyl-N-methylethanolamine N-methyltransferase